MSMSLSSTSSCFLLSAALALALALALACAPRPTYRAPPAHRTLRTARACAHCALALALSPTLTGTGHRGPHAPLYPLSVYIWALCGVWRVALLTLAPAQSRAIAMEMEWVRAYGLESRGLERRARARKTQESHMDTHAPCWHRTMTLADPHNTACRLQHAHIPPRHPLCHGMMPLSHASHQLSHGCPLCRRWPLGAERRRRNLRAASNLL